MQPTPEQLVVIEEYREKYLQAFGVYPAGSHYLDALDKTSCGCSAPAGIPTGAPGERPHALTGDAA